MTGKYILIDCFEREISTPIIFDTIEAARAQMKVSLIGAMDGVDDSIFDEYTKDDDYGWEPDGNCAWLDARHGNSDWLIVSVADMVEHTKAIVES